MARFQRESGELPRRSGIALLLTSAILAILAACTDQPAPPPTPVAVAAPVPQPITAVLAAGDASIPVFDNAIEYFRDLLSAPGVPDRRESLLSARRQRPADEELSALSTLEARIQTMHPAPGSSCLVFLTSHGAEGEGLWLAATRGMLTPAELDQSLDVGCGAAPTVVIVSSCYSGQFAVPPMTRPNRIVLTAARSDRTSFGCGAGFTFTYFDECLLGSLPNAANWEQVYARTRGCVAQREHQIGAVASEPQAYFGDAVRDLPAPLPPQRPASAARVQFTPSPTPFRPRLVPIEREERQREFDSLKTYIDMSPPKALAVTPSGFIAIGTPEHAPSATEDDVARLAVQRCELISGGACILFARDNTMTELLPSGQPPFHPLLLVRSGTVEPATVPFIRDDQRQQIAQYLTLPSPKALALSPVQGEIGVGSGATPDEARQAALEACRAGQRDCLLYAEDDKVVLGWDK